MKGWQTVLVAILLNLIANEIFQVSSRLAMWLVEYAARRSTSDSELAETRAEEWADVISSRPGNLMRLATALGFVGWAAAGRLHETWLRARGAVTGLWMRRMRRLRNRSAHPRRRRSELRKYRIALIGGVGTASSGFVAAGVYERMVLPQLVASTISAGVAAWYAWKQYAHLRRKRRR